MCAVTSPISSPGGRASTSATIRSDASRSTFLLLLLLTQAVTGLVLAGTDLFYPPIGAWIADRIAAPGVDPATLVPYAKEMYDQTAYEAMRAFRNPFITMHYYNFFVLLTFAVIHVLAVVVTELREGGTLISAMFSGRKVLSVPPADRTNAD